MFERDQSDDGSAESQNLETEETESNETDLKAEVGSLKEQLNQISAMLAAANQANQPAKPTNETKKLTSEEYDKLLKENPKAAVQLAVADAVELSTHKIEQRLTQNQQIAYFDQKLEQDFPTYRSDKKFQSIVQQEARDLVSGGMTKDSPKLMYKAAEIAALKYKGATEARNDGKGGMSGEAPTTGTRKSTVDNKHLPANFDKMARMFNLNDKAKEKAKEIFAHKAKLDQHRRGRN